MADAQQMIERSTEEEVYFPSDRAKYVLGINKTKKTIFLTEKPVSVSKEGAAIDERLEINNNNTNNLNNNSDITNFNNLKVVREYPISWVKGWGATNRGIDIDFGNEAPRLFYATFQAEAISDVVLALLSQKRESDKIGEGDGDGSLNEEEEVVDDENEDQSILADFLGRAMTVRLDPSKLEDDDDGEEGKDGNDKNDENGVIFSVK